LRLQEAISPASPGIEDLPSTPAKRVVRRGEESGKRANEASGKCPASGLGSNLGVRITEKRWDIDRRLLQKEQRDSWHPTVALLPKCSGRTGQLERKFIDLCHL
jgi:hypothetical protein